MPSSPPDCDNPPVLPTANRETSPREMRASIYEGPSAKGELPPSMTTGRSGVNEYYSPIRRTFPEQTGGFGGRLRPQSPAMEPRRSTTFRLQRRSACNLGVNSARQGSEPLIHSTPGCSIARPTNTPVSVRGIQFPERLATKYLEHRAAALRFQPYEGLLTLRSGGYFLTLIMSKGNCTTPFHSLQILN